MNEPSKLNQDCKNYKNPYLELDNSRKNAQLFIIKTDTYPNQNITACRDIQSQPTIYSQNFDHIQKYKESDH